jgi:acyl carrier protein
VLVTTKAAAARILTQSVEPAAEDFTPEAKVVVGAHTRHERPEMSTSYAAPTTETESRVVEIWQELLGIAPVGIYDDFFELGGHSLLATQIISRVGKAFGVGISLRSLFETAVVADFAARVDGLLASSATAPQAPVGEREEVVL